MKILAIETSCDETAISIVEAEGGVEAPSFRILSEVVTSQLALHAHWGGVVPSLAKREHQRALVPALTTTLSEATLQKNGVPALDTSALETILSRETELYPQFIDFISTTAIPDIDAIAVTYGPGLEPALWVGVNFARALSLAWNKPLIPVNHMEGHFLSAAIEKDGTWRGISYPTIALLVSGGHTEIVLSESANTYKILGSTRDDAVGEAFDKVARILGLPYPGGPAISKLAEAGLHRDDIHLPRPMMQSRDFDFSYSGLKTAVLYLVRDLETKSILDDATKAAIAREFENAALEVLVSKTIHAAVEYNAATIIVGGGVSANKKLHTLLMTSVEKELPSAPLLFPAQSL